MPGKISVIAAAVILLSAAASGRILNVPSDYPTIQAGIDASLNGDTVLVQPGTYVENINFNGHNIVLGSLYLTTNDTSYRWTTTIQSNIAQSVIKFENGENSDAKLCGFTIKNGFAEAGGGIFCRNASPSISHNIIVNNSAIGSGLCSGGGLYFDNSNSSVRYNIISHNLAWNNGGGIFCINSNLLIDVNIIIENRAIRWYDWITYDGNGGGICLTENSNAFISYNIISFNFAAQGSGIYCESSNPYIFGSVISLNLGYFPNMHSIPAVEAVFLDNASNPLILNTIIWGNYFKEISCRNNSVPDVRYSDIRGGWEGIGNISADPLFINAGTYNFSLCAQSPCRDAGDPAFSDGDLTRSDIGIPSPHYPDCFQGVVRFVSTTGNDTTGDGTVEYPFKTIQHAINNSLHGDTVMVERGEYLDGIDMYLKNIVVASRYLYSGAYDDIFLTEITGGDLDPAVSAHFCDSSSTVVGFRITHNNYEYGSGIQSIFSDTKLKRNVIMNNREKDGAGIFCIYGNPLIAGSIIAFNSASQTLSDPPYGWGGGLCLYHSNANFINNTLYGNTGFFSNQIAVFDTCISRFVNTIIWSDTASTTNDYYIADDAFVGFSYCNTRDTLFPGDGNISVTPLFRDSLNGDFHLMSVDCGDLGESPCIDAGRPDILDIILDCGWGLSTSRSDMGAYGGGDYSQVGMEDRTPQIPEQFTLSQNHPNPFNTQTLISYDLPVASDLTIEIFDILGRSVAVLVNERQTVGAHSVIWDTDNAASGVYFYRLQAGDYSDVKRCVLIR